MHVSKVWHGVKDIFQLDSPVIFRRDSVSTYPPNSEVTMSLVCDETGSESALGTPFYAGTRDDVPFYSALHANVIARIPETERRPSPCLAGDGGVDIHEASASASLHGTYSRDGFELGKFLFSVSHETACKYLPKHLARYKRQAN